MIKMSHKLVEEISLQKENNIGFEPQDDFI